MDLVLKCDTCVFKCSYRTGSDEYPANTFIEYCNKGRWENGPEPDIKGPNADPWHDCPDYKQKQQIA